MSLFLGTGVLRWAHLDGPQKIHDLYRLTKDKKSTYNEAIRGYNLLQKYRVDTEILCVVNAHNAKLPLEIYRFFKGINAHYITFLPLVEPLPDTINDVSDISVSAEPGGNSSAQSSTSGLKTILGRLRCRYSKRHSEQRSNKSIRSASSGQPVEK